MELEFTLPCQLLMRWIYRGNGDVGHSLPSHRILISWRLLEDVRFSGYGHSPEFIRRLHLRGQISRLPFPSLSLCLSVSISCLSPRSTFHCWAPSPHHKPSLSITHCVCRVLFGFLDGSLSLMFNAQWIGGIELIEAALPMNEVASALGLS